MDDPDKDAVVVMVTERGGLKNRVNQWIPSPGCVTAVMLKTVGGDRIASPHTIL